MRPVVVIGGGAAAHRHRVFMGLMVFSLLMMAMVLAYFPAAVVRERVGWKPGSGERLSASYDSRNPASVRRAALLRAADVAGQIAFEDAAAAGKPAAAGDAVRLRDAKGEVHAGKGLYDAASRSLVLLKAAFLLTRIPGVWSLVNVLTRDKNGK